MRIVIVCLALAATLAGGCTGLPGPRAPLPPGARLDAIFVASDLAVVAAMLEAARVGPDDVVYDLGSGDGRIVITAASRYGARGVGVEIDPELVRESRENAAKAGVADRVSFEERDLFTADIGQATVVAIYLGQEVNLRLRPKLLAELRPGARVVSHDFDMGDWLPERTIELPLTPRVRRVFLWTIPGRRP